MSLKKKFIAAFMLLILVLPLVAFSASASSEKATSVDKFYSYEPKLLCISYRGDTADYPENSLEGIKSALQKGADFVSVSVDKTKDGVFYLCERESLGNVCDAPYESLSQVDSSEIKKYSLFDVYGKKTAYNMTSLAELIENTDSKDGIILDVLAEHKEEVYEILRQMNALDRIIIRIKEGSAKLTDWAKSKAEDVNVIAIYSGNIIFSTVSAINNATKAAWPAVQYQSKNYFNVAFGDFFANRYLVTSKARAVAATYSPDLCGQRGDDSSTWNELISKGYSVIETNNVESFVAYREETQRLENEILKLLDKSVYVDTAVFSEVSIDNLNTARLNAELVILDTVVSSLGKAQAAYSQLLFALEDMKISSGEVDTRGALNVTAGKVIAAVLVGIVFLASQIYLYKMRKSTKEKI